MRRPSKLMLACREGECRDVTAEADLPMLADCVDRTVEELAEALAIAKELGRMLTERDEQLTQAEHERDQAVGDNGALGGAVRRVLDNPGPGFVPTTREGTRQALEQDAALTQLRLVVGSSHPGADRLARLETLAVTVDKLIDHRRQLPLDLAGEQALWEKLAVYLADLEETK